MRSDIFSFGSILYEMITNVRAFQRPSAATTLAAVLKEDPRPLRELAPDVPPELERIVDRCLRKDRERRLRSMSDLALSLRELKEESGASSRRPSRNWGVVLGGIVVAGGLFFALRHRDMPSAAALPPAKVVPLTTYLGDQKDPSLSPDGRQVVFSWNGADQKNFDLYLKPTAAGPPLRVTTDPAEDLAPAWSPDGGTIAFLRASSTATRYSVLLIPALGGPERRLAEISIPDRQWVPTPFLSWFPDGQALAVIDAQAGGPTALFRLSVRTGERTALTVPPAGTMGDASPAVSPDGRTLVFSRIANVGEWAWSIHAMTIGSGPESDREVLRSSETRYAVGGNMLQGLAWTPDGRRLVYAAAPTLWSLPWPASGLPQDAPRKIEVGDRARQPALSRESSRIVFSLPIGGDNDIWRVRLPKAQRRAEPPVRLVASTRQDFAPQYSPDGRRIAFESDRGGNLEIWVCDAEGGSCSALTSMGSAFTGTPGWSPDGKQVAYYSRTEGKAQIFAIGREGGAYRQVTADGSSHMFPRWSRDGRFLYFASNRSGKFQVFRVADGGGEAVQVTRDGGFASLESPDGQWLYYTKSEAEDAPLLRMKCEGGEEAQVLPSVIFHNFDVVAEGIYYVSRANGARALRFRSLGDGKDRVVTAVADGYVGLSVSPDREWVLYTETNAGGSNLSLLEDFRP